MRALPLALIAVVITAVAGCGSTPRPPAASSTTPPTASRSTSTTAHRSTSTTASETGSQFVPIVEPFDPGHPATAKPDPGSCSDKVTTIGIEQCFETKAENVDAAIDAAQLASFDASSSAGRVGILASDKSWLAARGPVCSVEYNTGGTIDGINIASCLLDESNAQLNALKGITPALTTLTSTDDPDPDAINWYTAPDGSRIGELDTQGDQTGGVIIGWSIVGGPDGFVVDPSDFTFTDGSFVDEGVLEPPDPTGHRVATGVEYQFGIDYSRLSSDPNETKRTGGFLYAPGGVPTALWR